MTFWRVLNRVKPYLRIMLMPMQGSRGHDAICLGGRARKSCVPGIQEMSDDKGIQETSTGKFVLPSLTVSRMSVGPAAVLTSLLLVDIAATFGISVGIAGQLRASSYLASVVLALAMSVLSIRFDHRSLLVTGLALGTVSALGCGLAMDFNSLLLFYSFNGLGAAMLGPMINTLIAEYFPLQKRASAMSFTIGGASAMYALGAPVVGIVAGFGGWRFAFLSFVFPFSLLALVLTIVALPSTRTPKLRGGSRTYLQGFKSIFTNRSAVACLVAPALSVAAFQVLLLYSASFLRQQFLLPTSLVSINSMVSGTTYTIGTLIGGRFVNKFGRKPLAVSAAFLAGLFIMAHMNMPNLWVALAACQTGLFFAGLRVTAASSLTLEQVPSFRGTMMSLYAATDSVGATLGAGIGGLVLLFYGYGVLGLSIGAMGIIGSILLYFVAIDPTEATIRKQS